MAVRTPPHLAEPRLSYAAEAEGEPYLSAITRGFHQDYVAEHWEAERKVFEWDRSFGLMVDDRWIATCGAYSRTMTVPGAQVPVAAVSIVTVAPAYRRRGLLRRMMQHQLEDVQQRGREPLALLWASESLIYGRFGYGHTAPRLSISGATRSTAFLPGVDHSLGSVDEVSSAEFLPAATALHAAQLPDRPGALDRSPEWWAVRLFDPKDWRNGASALRFALHFDQDGKPDGYAVFRTAESQDPAIPGREVQIRDLEAQDPGAYAALWRYLLDLDLVRRFSRGLAPVDEPLRHLVADQRAIKTEVLDGTYARLVDVTGALQARSYRSEVDTVLQLIDPLLPRNDGRWRLQAGPEGSQVDRSTGEPDLTMSVRDLGAAYLGGTSLDALHRAGLVQEHTAGSAAALAAALAWPTLPFCPDEF